MRPSPFDERFAAFLRRQRGEKAYRAFAPKLGLTRSTLYRLENLEQSVTLTKLHDILVRLRCSADEIFFPAQTPRRQAEPSKKA
jgi:transcriptional regulator with XRE-family HTH domain